MNSAYKSIVPYLLLQYLMKEADEQHPKQLAEIADHICSYGVTTEEHTVSRLIKEMNVAMYILENEPEDGYTGEEDPLPIEEAEEWIKKHKDSAYIALNRSNRGYYMRQRPDDFNESDIRLLAECIYSARFIEKKQTMHYVNEICQFVSRNQAKRIKHDAPSLDRLHKTRNRDVFHNIDVISEALKKTKDHKPEKLRFKYYTNDIENLSKPKERHEGEEYLVSPFSLLISEGNYYLICFDEKKTNHIKTFRIDRMKYVSLTGEPREGDKELRGFDFDSYAETAFNMYEGEEERIILQFEPDLLDTMVDRFGIGKGVSYSKDEDTVHYRIYTRVRISKQFFGWLAALSDKVKILEPESVVNQFMAFIEKIQSKY